jgi:hypothetical protein
MAVWFRIQFTKSLKLEINSATRTLNDNLDVNFNGQQIDLRKCIQSRKTGIV